MPITDILEKNARLYGSEIALTEINPKAENKTQLTWREYALIESNPGQPYKREITWAAFDKKANRLANLLLARGVKKGQKIAILLMNCLEWLPVYFGILKAGAMAVPLNYRYTAEEIDYCLRLSDAQGLIFGPEFTERIGEILPRMEAIDHLLYVGEDCPDFADSYSQLTEYCSHRSPRLPLTDQDEAAIYFSSGTTGFPKAIVHDHQSLMHATLTEQAHHRQTKDDVFLCIPPLYHTGAKMHWFGSFLVGGKAVLLKGIRPQWILETVSREQCSIVWLLVPWAQDILDAIDRGELDPAQYDLSRWRLMHIGAQPVPPSLIKRWKERFPNHEYDTNYGLSESIGPGCVHLGTENLHKVGAIGKAGYGWQVKIVGPAGKPVPQGEVGELAVKGPGVMKEYYKDPKATAEVLKDGWLFTGDMATQDEDGFIFLVDRKKDVIISGGENLYPVQIEDFLRKHQSLSDVAVIGLPDSRLGEIAAAVVQVKEGHSLTEEDLRQFCLELPRYKRPHAFIFAQVPRNPTGKIEKPKLRKLYGADRVVAQQNEIQSQEQGESR